MKQFLIFAITMAVTIWYLVTPDHLEKAFGQEKLLNYEAMLTVGSEKIRITPDEPVPPRTGKVLLIVPPTIKSSRFMGSSTRLKFEWRMNGKQIDPPRFHPAMYDLDDALRADSPEEVATVIFCEKANAKIIEETEHVVTEHYEMWWEWDMGRRKHVDLKVYDLSTRRFLGAYRLIGPPPADAKPGSQECGPEPDLAAFVAKMPLQ